MSGQIVNVSNDEAISEVALKCGDPFFKDFPRNIYSQGVYRAQRSIAHDYGIMERVWTYTNAEGTSPIEIAPMNFEGAWRVTITHVDEDEQEYSLQQLDKTLDDLDDTNHYYTIIYNANKYMLYYKFASVDDLITIYYTSGIAGEEDYEYLDADGNVNAIPVLPNKYFEEVIRRAVRYMAQLGMATFEAQKAEKYDRLLRIYTRRIDNVQDNKLEKSRPWIELKPYIYP